MRIRLPWQKSTKVKSLLNRLFGSKTAPVQGTPVFMHIPKTAGTTLNTAISSHYDAERVAYLYPPHNITAPETVGELDFFGGHLVYGEHESYGIEDPQYFTFLRDPVDRIVSQYYYSARYHDGEHGGHVLDGHMEPYLSQTKIWFFDNCMTRMFAGIRDEVAFGSLDDEVYETAVRNAKTFLFIGTQENFDEDQQRLASLLDWKSDAKSKRLNTGGYRREEIRDSDARYLETLSHYDQRLYAEFAGS